MNDTTDKKLDQLIKHIDRLYNIICLFIEHSDKTTTCNSNNASKEFKQETTAINKRLDSLETKIDSFIIIPISTLVVVFIFIVVFACIMFLIK